MLLPVYNNPNYLNSPEHPNYPESPYTPTTWSAPTTPTTTTTIVKYKNVNFFEERENKTSRTRL